MASIGEHANQCLVARRREANYIANFRSRFHNGLTVAHPATNEVIRFADWSSVEQLEDEMLQLGHYLNIALMPAEQQWHYPYNVRVRYWIEPKSLGRIFRKYPTTGFVIECATLSRLERLVTIGYDEESLGLSTVEQLLQDCRSFIYRWSARYGVPVTYLVGLASTTGWDEESIGYIYDFVDDDGLLPYLVDLATLNVYSSNVQPKIMLYRELFEWPLGDKKVKQIQEAVKELLLVTGASYLVDLQAQIPCSQGLLRAACTQLVKNDPDYRILQTGNNLVIRIG